MTDIGENSRSRNVSRELASRILARPRELIVLFLAPSRNPRRCEANSRSRLETRDIEETNLDLVSNNEIRKNLDLVSKKTRYIVYFNHHMMFNQNHIISPNIITLLSVKIFHFHPASGETSKIIKTQCIALQLALDSARFEFTLKMRLNRI